MSAPVFPLPSNPFFPKNQGRVLADSAPLIPPRTESESRGESRGDRRVRAREVKMIYRTKNSEKEGRKARVHAKAFVKTLGVEGLPRLHRAAWQLETER